MSENTTEIDELDRVVCVHGTPEEFLCSLCCEEWNEARKCRRKQEEDKNSTECMTYLILGKHHRSYMLRGLNKEGRVIIDHVYNSMEYPEDVTEILNNFKKMGCTSAEVLEEAYILKQVINEL